MRSKCAANSNPDRRGDRADECAAIEMFLGDSLRKGLLDARRAASARPSHLCPSEPPFIGELVARFSPRRAPQSKGSEKRNAPRDGTY